MSTIRSRKNKGRMLQNKVRDILRESYINKLEDGDIESRPMGCSGTDIILSPLAMKMIPFDIECKNQEKLNLLSAIEQAETNAKRDRISIVIFKKNRSKIFCCLKLNDLVKIDYTYQYIDKSLIREVKTLDIWKKLDTKDWFAFKYNNYMYMCLLFEHIIKNFK